MHLRTMENGPLEKRRQRRATNEQHEKKGRKIPIEIKAERKFNQNK
jgi:hypothetical protein